MERTETSLTLSWKQPGVVVDNLTGYTLQCSKGKYEVLSRTCSGNFTNTLTVDGLAPNSHYQCKVSA